MCDSQFPSREAHRSLQTDWQASTARDSQFPSREACGITLPAPAYALSSSPGSRQNRSFVPRTPFARQLPHPAAPRLQSPTTSSQQTWQTPCPKRRWAARPHSKHSKRLGGSAGRGRATGTSFSPEWSSGKFLSDASVSPSSVTGAPLAVGSRGAGRTTQECDGELSMPSVSPTMFSLCGTDNSYV